MKIRAVKLAYFSPTGTTKKVVEGIAEAIQVGMIDRLDLTSPEAQTRRFEELQQDELTVIKTPVYEGRVPTNAIHRLQKLETNNTPAAIVVVYGNRDYDDALLELNDRAIEIGFKPVVAGAFIGEHSGLKTAIGRPDSNDLKKARDFGKKIWENLEDIKAVGDISPLQIPGNFPYVEPATDKYNIYPITKETLCKKW